MAVETPPAPSPTADQTVKWGLPLVVLVSGMFMSVLDTSIVNVAVPTIEAVFGKTTDEVAWIVTAYALSLGVVVPLMFFLGSVFALLWGTAYFLGRKIERERAAAYSALRGE